MTAAALSSPVCFWSFSRISRSSSVKRIVVVGRIMLTDDVYRNGLHERQRIFRRQVRSPYDRVMLYVLQNNITLSVGGLPQRWKIGKTVLDSAFNIAALVAAGAQLVPQGPRPPPRRARWSRPT
jgi:hypothetical protein